jgi:hypothetical protein
MALYRFEGSWVKYPATSLGASGEYELFSVSVPGFSYFAIAATQPAPTQAPTTPAEQPVTPAEQPITPEQTPPAEIIDAPSESNLIWWVIGIIVALLAVGLLLLQRYRSPAKPSAQQAPDIHTYIESMRKHGVSDEQIETALLEIGWRVDQLEKEFPNHPISNLRAYVLEMRARKMSDDGIKQKLLSIGWDVKSIDEELRRKK